MLSMRDCVPTSGGEIKVLLLVAACLLASACGEPPAVTEEDTVRPVRYVFAWTAGADRTRTFGGVARAGSESSLSFRVGGMIAHVDARVGDRVRAGDPIARIDAVDYELQVKEAEAALRQADALAGNAGADLRRAWALYENDNFSRTALDGAIAASDSAAAQVEAAAKRLELAQRQVRYATLRAPAAGVIADVAVSANENVAGGQPVVVLTSDALPEVEFYVPEGLISEVRENMPVSATFNAIPNQRFTGSVTEVGVALRRPPARCTRRRCGSTAPRPAYAPGWLPKSPSTRRRRRAWTSRRSRRRGQRRLAGTVRVRRRAVGRRARGGPAPAGHRRDHDCRRTRDRRGPGARGPRHVGRREPGQRRRGRSPAERIRRRPHDQAAMPGDQMAELPAERLVRAG